ncbi:hypothetical protein GALL_122030 [mine drainage metagenome]|uniref:Uncharacterized protein n=1 Tax=mine drainage metagenome TaxID=410659 RepID=A0A1J5SNZ9_9ZZZZ
MEKLGTLIIKLKEQFDQNEGADKLLITAKLLVKELHQHLSDAEKYANPPVVSDININFFDSKLSKNIPAKKEEGSGWLFDPIETVPTLIHQQPIKPAEINETISTHKESVNDKLKEEKTELASALQSAPVRDLKKAIGLNDRYLFISELFRGDENMYERSIKTINNFSIYPEAEYWIQRELKVKLGWRENKEAVRLFDQIVRRRFS